MLLAVFFLLHVCKGDVGVAKVLPSNLVCRNAMTSYRNVTTSYRNAMTSFRNCARQLAQYKRKLQLRDAALVAVPRTPVTGRG